jgi:5-oxoprolinase (ATP-hydrolysing) subunit A
VKIDLNCDVGEGYGNDAELMGLVTSANIACGYHAGDVETMRSTVAMALDKGVAVGAHPGYPDREGFGRRAMSLSMVDLFQIVTDQIIALREITLSAGGRLSHVKPHGSLYNQAANDPDLAKTIARAVFSVDKDLILFGLSGSAMIDAGVEAGLRTAAEVFADRTYRNDASLTPRSDPNALIMDTDRAVSQILQIVNQHHVNTIEGAAIPMIADTICIHGDGANAIEYARTLRECLLQNHVELAPVSDWI